MEEQHKGEPLCCSFVVPVGAWGMECRLMPSMGSAGSIERGEIFF